MMPTFVGSRFTGGDLGGIYTGMGLAWGAGALVGPSIFGVAMAWSRANWSPRAIAAGCTAFAILVAFLRSET